MAKVAMMFFESETQMYELCKEWQMRLELQDWFIDVQLVSAHEIGTDNAGECLIDCLHKTGIIKILKKEEFPDGCILKQPQEETLIHELLHLKFVSFEEKNREEAFFELIQHQTLESIARALYMAKYDLDRK